MPEVLEVRSIERFDTGGPLTTFQGKSAAPDAVKLQGHFGVNANAQVIVQCLVDMPWGQCRQREQ